MRTFVSWLLCVLFVIGIFTSYSTYAEESGDLSIAENFVDAFYSFEKLDLEKNLSAAKASMPAIIFYQGWAEGGNYKILHRNPCIRESQNEVSCSITVKDDLIQALGIGFNVTDTFHLTIEGGAIVSVRTTSDDPQEFRDAEAWVRRERGDLIRESCKGYFNGGATPGDCVKDMVRGFREYTASHTIGSK